MRPRHPSLGTVALLCLAVSSSMLAPRVVRSDELKLKDGTKISGTIVGFEENSFKVKTSYGFAEVQKDQVVSISITAAKPVASPAPAPEKPKPETASVAPVATKPVVKAELPAAPVSAPKVAAATPAPIAATPVADSAPPMPPAPVPIHEEVVGNLYTNDTYRFHMYKPPDWEVIAGARKLLPGTIVALGTDDETTYLLIGQQPAGESLTSDIRASEQRLRDVMDNFRSLGEEHVTIGGAPAIEHRFRGGVDNQDWSGVAVFLLRGGQVYTIFGMTRADSDLVQIQENVIDRAISSLQFTQQ
ncbi:MAG: hypothetical protein WAN23_04160 [Candidatus Acidiferrales bacterium]